MLNYFLLLIVCQLLGELTVHYLQLPFPGPVVGILMLFIYLVINRGIPEPLEKVSSLLLRYLSLLFVPVGVGVMAHADLLKVDLLPISLSIIVSTIVGLCVTAWVMDRMSKKNGNKI